MSQSGKDSDLIKDVVESNQLQVIIDRSINMAVSKALRENVLSGLVSLVKQSGERMDRIDHIVSELSSSIHENHLMYDKHLTSLERCRDASVNNEKEHIKANGDMAHEIELIRKTLEELSEERKRIMDAYIDLSRTMSSTRQEMNMNINSSNL